MTDLSTTTNTDSTDAALDSRVDELLPTLSLAEKAGLMFHAMAFVDPAVIPERDGDPLLPGPVYDFVVTHHVTAMNLVNILKPAQQVRWYNALQVLARQTGSGIPVTVSSDPRSAVAQREGASHRAGSFSAWPEPVGMAATRDAQLAHAFGDTIRQEFQAVGIRLLLGPQVDIATEPRWSRISGTWGGDPELTGTLASAFIKGLQGDVLGPDSVAAMVKHFPGGGPQKDGEDPHFSHGTDQVYPGGHLAEHVAPFRAAIAAGANQVMAYYGKPVGTELEEVAFAFNRQVLTGMLRGDLGFTGIISSDWGVLNDHDIMGDTFVARAWGIEHLDPVSRTQRAIEAGTDQFGGDYASEMIVELVQDARVPESRIDESVRRILREKFRLGLFDASPLSETVAAAVAGRADFVEAGLDAQRRSLTLLTNSTRVAPAGHPSVPVLPLTGRPRVFSTTVDDTLLAEYADVVTDPAAADFAILRLQTPHDHRQTTTFETFFHSGPLDFGDDELADVLDLLFTVPTIVVLNLERPAVVPEIAQRAAALVVEYGSTDHAVLDVLFGRANPEGRLPFQLPASMVDVLAGDLDEPHRFTDPLFDFGFGLSYDENFTANNTKATS
ncbi:glycoside hydrolase family 3 protein [Subtercola endophyticus]|uniref:glycoside hydrolase family 3 protein n=1 Tax=Subtercola endophyticus TaxID=2895559 RepID=UPI001E5A68C8|nr:glycoside hydrolase family 3 N-terminal domain-containing protein [Subtercola endophyticus]UFS60627.1 glycoside hydrolase family 3 C-terminal domain-containing protein [Subtercola endophyticus]